MQLILNRLQSKQTGNAGVSFSLFVQFNNIQFDTWYTYIEIARCISYKIQRIWNVSNIFKIVDPLEISPLSFAHSQTHIIHGIPSLLIRNSFRSISDILGGLLGIYF